MEGMRTPSTLIHHCDIVNSGQAQVQQHSRNRSTVPAPGGVLTHHHHFFRKRDTACTQSQDGYVGVRHHTFIRHKYHVKRDIHLNNANQTVWRLIDTPTCVVHPLDECSLVRGGGCEQRWWSGVLKESPTMAFMALQCVAVFNWDECIFRNSTPY